MFPHSLDMEYGVCYPFVRYPNCTAWKAAAAQVEAGNAAVVAPYLKRAHQYQEAQVGGVFLNPSRRTVTLFVVRSSSMAHFNTHAYEDLDQGPEDWTPEIAVLQEFSVASQRDAEHFTR